MQTLFDVNHQVAKNIQTQIVKFLGEPGVWVVQNPSENSYSVE
jgi:hypothetical protein